MFKKILIANRGEITCRAIKTARKIVLATSVIGMGMMAVPAAACSFTWKEGFSPEEIRERKDLRKVIGEFQFLEWKGNVDQNGELYDGTIYSRLTTRRGTGWDTWQDYHRFSVDCGAYRKPLDNARGIFYVSRRKVDGRYEILLWDGEYLPTEKTEGEKH